MNNEDQRHHGKRKCKQDGRDKERMREGHLGPRRYPGVHATGQGESLSSRSADPGQSSYGGFANEDPGFQRQQLEPAQGARERILPKGYVRSDERIYEDVCEKLSHSGLDVSEVSGQCGAGESDIGRHGKEPARQACHRGLRR